MFGGLGLWLGLGLGLVLIIFGTLSLYYYAATRTALLHVNDFRFRTHGLNLKINKCGLMTVAYRPITSY